MDALMAPPPRPNPDIGNPAAGPVGGDGSKAPTYTVPPRRLGAVEHPMIIKDLDKGMKTLGQPHSFKTALYSASPQVSVPLYFRPDNPTVRPLTSHNARTHNVILKVTVPKRTGRKRKRGSDGPFEGRVHEADGAEVASHAPEDVRSRERLDQPKVLRRKLIDNVDKYTIEPVGVVTNTHRYRGSADFQYSMGNSRFMNNFVDTILSGSVPKLRQFSLTPGVDRPPNIELIPPPFFTPISMPFPYNYSQNPHVREVGGRSAASDTGLLSAGDEFDSLVNTTSRAPAAGYFLGCREYPVPTRPRSEPNLDDPQITAIMEELRQAMEERPVWTRRSMLNRLSVSFGHLPKRGALVRYCMNYAGYQFKGGPWRDALVRYGVDPRSDPKYRIYQTLIFKLHKTHVGTIGRSWQSVRREEFAMSSNFGRIWRGKGNGEISSRSHEFDGEQFSTDGKVWQVCDITDPLLAKLFAESDVLPACDPEGSGFYPSPVWAIAKGIMKRKMLAIRFGRTLEDDAFGAALRACREACRNEEPANTISVPLPDLNLTLEEKSQVSGRRFKGNRRRKYRSSNKVRAEYSVHKIKMPGMGKVTELESPVGDSGDASEGLGPDRANAQGVPGEMLPGSDEGDEGDEEEEREELQSEGDSLQDLLESDEDDSAIDSEEESEVDDDIEEDEEGVDEEVGMEFGDEDGEEEEEEEEEDEEDKDEGARLVGEEEDDIEEEYSDEGGSLRSGFDDEVEGIQESDLDEDQETDGGEEWEVEGYEAVGGDEDDGRDRPGLEVGNGGQQ